MIEPFLQAFLRHYTITRSFAVDDLIINHQTEAQFELSGLAPDGVCMADSGELVVTNTGGIQVAIINYERFIDLFGQGVLAGRGKKCDFLARAFNRFSEEIPSVALQGSLPGNFEFIQLRYPHPLVL
jgi:hypothetical protein